jgi:GT2 family glycosyltransferase/glycosyltransferase involved in cell wall biosynthesis
MWGTQFRQRLRLAPLYLAVALADRLAPTHRRPLPVAPSWREGISVVIPDRDAPELLTEALDSLDAALASIAEPYQIIVVANGAPKVRYAAILERWPTLEFVHDDAPCGFTAAIERGLARARHDWTLLLNNDMALEASALRELAAQRGADVFAIAAQIFQQSADGCREETGFVDWYVDLAGVHVFHAPLGDNAKPRQHLCASGGAALFRTLPLRRYVHESRCYDPFYWEDVEWGVRARRDGLRVLFCSAAKARHRHRATTARFYPLAEIDRIVERNRTLFDLRNAVTERGAGWLLQRVCDQPYASQRELASPTLAAEVFRHRWRARRASPLESPPVIASPGRAVAELASSYSFRLGGGSARPRVLLVTPFCVFPPRHGGARRIEGLLQRLRREFAIVLVTDEASLYDSRSFRYLDGLHAALLVQRREVAAAEQSSDLGERMRTHCHEALARAVGDALQRYRPDLVQVEHVELAGLSRLRGPGQRWILGLHDAFGPGDFRDPDAAGRLQDHLLQTYDAITVCSAEDHALIAHPRTVCVPNGTSIALGDHAPSDSTQLLFMGPFRYAQNLEGIRRFLRVAYPAIKTAVPAARLLVLGGDGAAQAVAGDPAFAQPDVSVIGHRDDVRELLSQSALTLNPLSGIRGSSVKVIESLAAGRACVSTEEGARGFIDAGLPGLITARDVAAMAQPIIGLLEDHARRRRIEAPDTALLAPFLWQHSAAIQSDLYRSLLEGGRA